MLRPVLFVVLAVQFSFCPEKPRMIRYFNYECAQKEALELAPEGCFMVTKMQSVKKKIFGQYDYRIAVLVEDRVEVIIVAQRKVFKRDSEASIGGKDMIQTEVSDKLPYTLQRSIFYPIIDEFTKNGLVEVEDITFGASA